MSSLSMNLMSNLTKNYLWMRPLTTTPQLEPEVGRLISLFLFSSSAHLISLFLLVYLLYHPQHADQLSERIGTVADKLEQCAAMDHGGASSSAAAHLSSFVGGGGGGGVGGGGGGGGGGDTHSKEDSALVKATRSR